MSDAVNKPAHYNQGPIECIDAMQQILTPEEFRGFLKGNVFKYLWREKGKNGIEDLRKGKDYYDRLIQSFDESEDQPVVKQSSTTEPPDGWRALQNGELLRNGDKRWNNYISWDLESQYIGINASNAFTTKFIRRNRFEVGEKVVAKDSNEIWEVDSIVNGVYQLRNGSVFFASFPEHLAPYIEEAK